MAREIGVRELKNQASQLVRAVREEMAEYIITVRGKPVAVLRPVTNEEAERLREADIDAELATMQELAKEIAAAWTSDKTGVELVEEQRR